MINFTAFADQLPFEMIDKRRVVALEALVDAIDKLNEGIIVSDNGIMLEPFVFTNGLTSMFPYAFYAQKYDPAEGVLHEAGESMLSPWFQELEFFSYYALDSENPIVDKSSLAQYLIHLKKVVSKQKRTLKDEYSYSCEIYLEFISF